MGGADRICGEWREWACARGEVGPVDGVTVGSKPEREVLGYFTPGGGCPSRSWWEAEGDQLGGLCLGIKVGEEFARECVEAEVLVGVRSRVEGEMVDSRARDGDIDGCAQGGIG